MSQTPGDGVARELEDCLRRITGCGELRVAGSLQRLTGGFDTEIFAFALDNAPADLSGGLVLRLFREPGDAGRARVEAAIHHAAAGRHRVPRMPVDSEGHLILGRPFIVMERVPGTALDKAIADPGVLAAAPALLARAQAGLHSLPSSRLVKALTDAGIDASRLSPFRMLNVIHRLAPIAGLESLVPVARWLDEHRPGQPEDPAICHGDFHPGNVIVDGGEVTGIIDWANVALGHAEFDVALTRLVISIGPLEGVPDEGLRELIDRAVAEYVAVYREQRPLDDELLTYYTVLRAAHALTKVAAARTGRDVPGAAHEGYAWALPVLLTAVIDAIRAETGIRVALPEDA